MSIDHIQALICHAADCLDRGNRQSSYDNYLKALDIALTELRQIKFVDQYTLTDNKDDLFTLAKSCLTLSQSILHMSSPKQPQQRMPPPIPPKPSFTTENTFPAAELTAPDTELLKPPARYNYTSSPPSSPLLLSGPIHAVKTLITSTTGSTKKSSQSADQQQDMEIFQLASGAVDPTCVVVAQTKRALEGGASPNKSVPSIPKPPLDILLHSLEVKLDNLTKHNLSTAEVRLTLNRVRQIQLCATTIQSMLQFSPLIVAYQLTLIDSSIFRAIQPEALLSHRPPKQSHPSVVASTDFFNYLTRIIEHAVLTQPDASGRAQHINFWVKVGCRCHELRNFQTLKAIVSALGTPPVQRLKRSWAFVPKKAIGRLEGLQEIMSEANNYGHYRERIAQQPLDEPAVPFLGVFMHDLTYLHACERKTDDVIALFQRFQSHPSYSPQIPAAHYKDLAKKLRRENNNIASSNNSSNSGANNSSSSSSISSSSSNNSSCSTSSSTSSCCSNSSCIQLGSIERQQCFITQYLLTRCWVSEKAVDELSLLLEPPPPKVLRSNSAFEESTQSVWSSTSSLLSFVVSSTPSSSSRPVSLEDDEINVGDCDDKRAWLMGRKSVDHNIKNKRQFRLSRHFSFEDLEGHRQKQQQQQQGLSLFRKDFSFWRSATTTPSPSTSTSTPRMHEASQQNSSSRHPLDQDSMYQQRSSISIA
ncbi:ras guanine nucleotide exchange factor domain-containing protein [Dichotomocladium elegans]|nr:ras guanine nucleotide exchange factor domain-containing protein [Dichotomocladium elegans]